MTQDDSDKILQPLRELCDDRGWSWKWRTKRGDQWHSEVKVEAVEGGRTVVKAWYGATGHGAAETLKSAVTYALHHIADLDAIPVKYQAYHGRVAKSGKFI